MKGFQKQFYATRRDLLPGILALEATERVCYALKGMFPKPEPVFYASVTDIPGFGISQHGDYNGGDDFLVTKPDTDFVVEEVPQLAGGMLYHMGLLENPTAFAFKPGGVYEDRAIITGSVDTATGDPDSLASAKQFWRSMSKGFVKIDGYHVGPEALQRLEEGWRLTPAMQCRPWRDLRR